MRYSEFDRIVPAELIRSANATGYSAGQAIASPTPKTLLTFLNAGRGKTATGYVRSVRISTNQSTCAAALTLWLYNDIPTITGDGVTFQNYWVERGMCLGHITLSALAKFGNSDYATAESWFTAPQIYACTDKTPNLYGQLVTGTDFTPASGQIFRVELGLHQNESGSL